MGKIISVFEARAKILANKQERKKEFLPIFKAHKRVLATEIFSPRDIPAFNRATMDGIAILEKKPLFVGQELSLVGELQAGEYLSPKKIPTLKEGQAIWVMTGAALPQEVNRVIPKEYLQQQAGTVCLTSLPSTRCFATQGEDAKKGQKLLSTYKILDERALAFCQSFGNKELEVFSAPRVAILSTGNEVVATHQTPKYYQITDINSSLLSVLLQKKNIPYQKLGIARDEKKILRKKINKGLEYDIFLISGGVSAGKYDLVPELLQEQGAKKIFHKVNLKPGKPLWFGRTKKTAIFGLPGNPVSVQVCYKLFVEPYIKHFLGYLNCEPNEQKTNSIQKKFPLLETYYPAKKDGYGIQPIIFHSSGDFLSLLESDGLVRLLPSDSQNGHKKFLSFLPWEI